MRKTWMILALAAVVVLSRTARADEADAGTLKEFREIDAIFDGDFPPVYVGYLSGVWNSLVLFDAYLTKYHAFKGLYCTGELTPHTYPEFVAILRREIEAPTLGHPYPPDFPLILIAVNGLRWAMVCRP